MSEGGGTLAAEHAGDFLDALGARDLLEAGVGAIVGVFFGDDELVISKGGDLG